MKRVCCDIVIASIVVLCGMLASSTSNAQFLVKAESLGPQTEWKRPSVDDGPDLWVYSIVCEGLIQRVSSSLAPQGTKSYIARNLGDDDPTTAWVEGVPGNGVGEWIESAETLGDGLCYIINGYQSSKAAFTNNGRVKSFTVFSNGKEVGVIVLLDVFGIQSFTIPQAYRNGRLRFVIREVYPGAKYQDTAISEFWWCGG